MIAASVITMFIVLTTALPLLKINHWVIRGLDFPRFQIAVLACAVALFHLIFTDLDQWLGQLNLLATLISLSVQLWWIIPYTPIWPAEVKSTNESNIQNQLSIMTANVLQTNHNTEALIQLVRTRKPDILVTLETNRWWQDQLAPIAIEMPHTIKCPLENLYGMHVYSRLPLAQEQISFLVEKDVPSMHCIVELRNGANVNMHFVHPAPPSPTENEESTERDAELITIAKSVATTKEPVIVTGDLNDVAWSFTTRLFRKISGLLDPRVGRGMYNTFHADYSFLRWPLDHLFHSEHFCLKHIERLPHIGSDHFSLFTVLSFEPNKGKEQEGLQPDKNDKKEAEIISEQVGVGQTGVPTLNE
ncbi:endonuclease/exonuclease/phosphatase family protein [Reinekea marina]|nr:endonuclease/exonuclease/phosphatase family protein [Reinekea marina]MDN3650105.1 endonuclease/exonuclease/phosphatase family protein [Reinekea marina]